MTDERTGNASETGQSKRGEGPTVSTELDAAALRALLEAVSDGIVAIDEQSCILLLNSATERLFGYSSAELLGGPITRLMPEDLRARHRAGIGRYLKTGQKNIPWEGVELVGQHKSGRTFPVEVSFGESLWRGQRIFTGIVRDITVRKEAANLIAAQAKAILELSTPVLQVGEGMIVVPIVGMIDSPRAREITEGILGAIRRMRAKVVILDITGVPAVDSKVAHHLLQTIASARLMGSQAIVTGLSPEVAQSLVHLGVELAGIHTASDLRAGIEWAERLKQQTVSRG